jgi:hypothetical protein
MKSTYLFHNKHSEMDLLPLKYRDQIMQQYFEVTPPISVGDDYGSPMSGQAAWGFIFTAFHYVTVFLDKVKIFYGDVHIYFHRVADCRNKNKNIGKRLPK